MYGGNNLVVVSRRREIGEVETTTTGGQPERWNAGLMLWWIDSGGLRCVSKGPITFVGGRMYNTHLYHSFVDGQCSLQRVGWQLQSSPTPTPPLLGKFLAKGEAWTSIFEHRPHG